MGRLFLILFGVSVMSACAGPRDLAQERREISSAHIGCAPNEISITSIGKENWAANCKGKTFYCTVEPSASCKSKLE
jgi:hypothetical protein